MIEELEAELTTVQIEIDKIINFEIELTDIETEKLHRLKGQTLIFIDQVRHYRAALQSLK